VTNLSCLVLLSARMVDQELELGEAKDT